MFRNASQLLAAHDAFLTALEALDDALDDDEAACVQKLSVLVQNLAYVLLANSFSRCGVPSRQQLRPLMGVFGRGANAAASTVARLLQSNERFRHHCTVREAAEVNCLSRSKRLILVQRRVKVNR